jgi:hypothetical protein
MHMLSHIIWSNYFEVGSVALKSGRHETAGQMFAAALTEAEKYDLPVMQQVASLHGLACAHLKSGRRGTSEILLRKAFRIICQSDDVNIEDLGNVACLLADSYLEQGEAAKAMPVLKLAAGQIGRRAGESEPALARLFKRIALIYSGCGRCVKAEQYFSRATKIESEFAGINFLS